MSIGELDAHFGQAVLVRCINLTTVTLKPSGPVPHIIDGNEQNIIWFGRNSPSATLLSLLLTLLIHHMDITRAFFLRFDAVEISPNRHSKTPNVNQA